MKQFVFTFEELNDGDFVHIGNSKDALTYNFDKTRIFRVVKNKDKKGIQIIKSNLLYENHKPFYTHTILSHWFMKIEDWTNHPRTNLFK